KRPQSIDFTMSWSDGYDTGSDLFVPGASNVPLRAEGNYSNIDAALRYTRVRGRRRLVASASDTIRYQPQRQDVLASTYQSSLAFASPPGRSGRLDLSQGVDYTPYYQLELFPMLPAEATQLPQAPSSDYAISKQSAFTYATRAGFSHGVGRRSTLQFGYEFGSVRFADDARDLLTESASVRFTRHANRYTGFYVGAATRFGRYGRPDVGARTRTEEVNVGLDVSRRRLSASAASGLSIIPVGGATYYRVTGNAVLRAEVSRTWTAKLQYARGLRFVEALAFPFFSDSISVGVSGQPSRRLLIGASGGYSIGEVGVSSEGGAYGTYMGSGQLTVPLSRHYAAYSEYVYYHYRFTERALADAFPPLLGRHTFRVGLRLWMPMLH